MTIKISDIIDLCIFVQLFLPKEQTSQNRMVDTLYCLQQHGYLSQNWKQTGSNSQKSLKHITAYNSARQNLYQSQLDLL